MTNLSTDNSWWLYAKATWMLSTKEHFLMWKVHGFMSVEAKALEQSNRLLNF
jgi:hypothetical protein